MATPHWKRSRLSLPSSSSPISTSIKPERGLDILQKARSLNPPAIVILITGFGTIKTALEAMKKGPTIIWRNRQVG